MNAPREPRRLELERWLNGELAGDARARFEGATPAHVLDQARSADRALRERLLRELPPEAFVARVRARVLQRAAPIERARTGWLALPVLAAATLVAMLWVRGGAVEPPVTRVPVRTERAKGLAPHLVVHRQRASGSDLLSEGSTCRPGDVLQLGYVGAARSHGVIVSFDGAGTVTLHHPSRLDASDASSASGALAPGGGEHLLPSSFELDAAPGFERFVFVSANRAIAVSAVMQAARELAADPARARSAALALPAWYEQHTVLLRKDR